ncbi:threonine-phosphate decarboxylase CobD [Brevibacillus sp. B_LB10_24]|uniref:threonine-phosphate decarboxylase CobD n=1 Tax=Brevibacillus sp. B_LB10_24 TaxID=3380645 RepID=UPI0038B77FC3
MKQEWGLPMAQVERHGHGGDLWSAGEIFGVNPLDLLDFSANINPLGPPDGLFARLAQALPDITRYPDPTCRTFRRKLSGHLGVAPEQLLIGNGAAECLQLAVTALAPRYVGLVYPSFSEYESAARKAGCEIIPLYTSAEQDFLPETDQLLALIDRSDMVFLGYPNNPTGNHLPIAALLEAARTCSSHKTYLCVDEAFIDFLPDGEALSLLSRLNEFPYLIVFRSLTKMYAIPGLRLGFAAASESVIARMAEKQIPWSVNHLAQVAGEYLLEDKDFIVTSQQFTAAQRESLAASLAQINGVRVFPSRTNYLLLRVGGVSSYDLQQRLAAHGMLIRNCSMYPGLEDGYVRVAVKGDAENRRLVNALAQALEGER